MSASGGGGGDQIAISRVPDAVAPRLGPGSNQDALDSSDNMMHAEVIQHLIKLKK